MKPLYLLVILASACAALADIGNPNFDTLRIGGGYGEALDGGMSIDDQGNVTSNGTATFAGGVSVTLDYLDAIGDVDTAGAGDLYSLVYDGTGSYWYARLLLLSDLGDMSIGGIANGQSIKWNTIGGYFEIADFADVNVAEIILADWDNTTNPWIDAEVDDVLTSSKFHAGTGTTDAVDLNSNEVAGTLPAASVGAGLTDSQIEDTVTAGKYHGTGSTTDEVDLGTAEVEGTLPAAKVGTGLTDAQVSDTLTASNMVGTGSTSNAVDLNTAETAGELPDIKVSNTLTASNGAAPFALAGDATMIADAKLKGVTPLYNYLMPESAAGMMHANSKGNITANIDTDSNYTSHYFAIYKDNVDGTGTALFRVEESGAVSALLGFITSGYLDSVAGKFIALPNATTTGGVAEFYAGPSNDTYTDYWQTGAKYNDGGWYVRACGGTGGNEDVIYVDDNGRAITLYKDTTVIGGDVYAGVSTTQRGTFYSWAFGTAAPGTHMFETADLTDKYLFISNDGTVRVKSGSQPTSDTDGTAVGAGSGGWAESFRPETMLAPSTGGASAPVTEDTPTNHIWRTYRAFDPSTEEHVTVQFALPPGFSGSTLNVHITTVQTCLGCGTYVVWKARGVAIGDGDSYEAAYGSYASTTIMGDLGRLEQATLAVTLSGSPVAGDLVSVDVARDATNGSDDFTTDARLYLIRVSY